MDIRSDVLEHVRVILKLIVENLTQNNNPTMPKIHIPYEANEGGPVSIDSLMSNDIKREGCTTLCLFDPNTARHYTRFMAAFALIAELILSQPKKTMSLRDVYYALKHEFRKQEESNAVVLEIGRFLGLKRHEMG